MKNAKNLQSEPDEGCNWILINALLLLVTGIVCFLVFLEFGSRGFIFVIPGAILVVLIVAMFYRRALNKQTLQDSKWVGASITAWAISFIVLMLVLGNAAEYLPYMGQVPTGGLGIMFYCLISMVIGPIVVLLTAGMIKLDLNNSGEI